MLPNEQGVLVIANQNYFPGRNGLQPSNIPKNNPSFVYSSVDGIVKIATCRGEIILVSECDAPYLTQATWFCNVHGYAIREVTMSNEFNKKCGRKKRKCIFMHRVIAEMMLLRPLELDEIVDHIDGDPLNNCRSNLRVVTKKQNRLNSRKRKDYTSSKYKGVSWHKANQNWCSRITIDKKLISLGTFSREEDAARAYNDAAKKYFGEYTSLNDVPDVDITQRSFEW